MKVADCRDERIIVVDDAIRRQFGDGDRRVAKADGHNRNAGRLGGFDVDVAVAHHQSVCGVAAGEADRSQKVIRVRFADGERVPAGETMEVTIEVECREQRAGQALALVRAHG